MLGNINVKTLFEINYRQSQLTIQYPAGRFLPNSKMSLTPETAEALKLVDKAISLSQSTKINCVKNLAASGLKTAYTPMGCLWQDRPVGMDASLTFF